MAKYDVPSRRSRNISVSNRTGLSFEHIAYFESGAQPAGDAEASHKFFSWGAETVWQKSLPAGLEPGSRHSLIRVLKQAAAMGFGVSLEIAAEFFMLESNQGISTALPHRPQHRHECGWLQQMRGTLNLMGWDAWNLYMFDREDGVGQLELSNTGANALTVADRYVFFRGMAMEIAAQQGGFAQFTPEAINGCNRGTQIKMSLFAGGTDKNLFSAGPGGATPLAGMFLRGIQDHLPSIQALMVACPQRQDAFSVPRLALTVDESGVMLSGMDGGSDPYHLSALLLAAGLDKITDLDTGDPPGIAYHKTRTLVCEASTDFEKLLDSFNNDHVARSVFGAGLHRLIETERRNWQPDAADTVQRRKTLAEKFPLPDYLRSR